jgi:hypothetical protein
MPPQDCQAVFQLVISYPVTVGTRQLPVLIFRSLGNRPF